MVVSIVLFQFTHLFGSHRVATSWYVTNWHFQNEYVVDYLFFLDICESVLQLMYIKEIWITDHELSKWLLNTIGINEQMDNWFSDMQKMQI